MRIMIEIGHPAHVHNFKNMIWNLEKKGHEIKIIAKYKEVSLELLNKYGFDYDVIGKNYTTLLGKVFGLIVADYKTYKISRKFRPDIFISRASPYSAHASRLIGKPHIAFCDTERAKLNDILSYPFTDVICTPVCFKKDLGSKQIRYNGYKELAYLHPKYFRPDQSVLDDLGLSKKDRYIILRFISWGAAHDLTLKGINRNSVINLIKSLERYGKVIVSSENKNDRKLESYKVNIPPDKLHSLLFYAQLYIGEGGTMAVESAVLGTPAIHIESTFSGRASGYLSGNFTELQKKYNLLFMFPDQKDALGKAIEILEDKKSKKKWREKSKKLLKDKIDVTNWMTEFVDKYPDSFYNYLNGAV